MTKAVNVYNKKSVGDFPTDLFIHNISIFRQVYMEM